MSETMQVICFLALLATVKCHSIIRGGLHYVDEFLNFWENRKQEPDHLLHQYDFIIVGAGTAGCVLANRLSENPNWTVLLIEAGRDENYVLDIPLAVSLIQLSSYNWDYKSEPGHGYCLGMVNRKCKLPRGKVMGGSSVLNYMIYARGNRRDYDHWAKLGNYEWSFEKVLPYFQKLENFTVDPNSTFNGHKGPLSVSYVPTRTALSKYLMSANLNYGLQYVNYNGPRQSGVSYLHVTQQDGVRFSSNRAYLYPIKDRPNLHVVRDTLAVKVLVSSSKQTLGVRIERRRKTFSVFQKKDVILSAGAIDSPKLLLLSGIGPARDLKKLGIPLVVNQPRVGRNLMDHIMTGLPFKINKPLDIGFNRAINEIPEYFNGHKGVNSVPGSCEILTFNDLQDPLNTDGHPDMELLFCSSLIIRGNLLVYSFGVHPKFLKYYEPIMKEHGFTIFPILQRPKSRGYVTLHDANPHSKPKIVTNYLKARHDVDTLIKGIKLALKIAQQPILRDELGAEFFNFTGPLRWNECPHLTPDFRGQMECLLRVFTFTIYHQTGTCKMGRSIVDSVVDQNGLKVHGIHGLRVVDASVMPTIVTTHTNGPVTMIAEMASDMIKREWGHK